MHDIHSVNHVGMAVADMRAAAARYEAMGFVLTPFSAHSGAWKPGDPVTKLGAGNRCAVFARNYLEILASEHAERPAERIERFIARHQGAHIVCFGTDAPDTVDARLVAAHVATSGVIPLQRDVETPHGTRTAKFRRTQFAPEASPEGYIQAAQHLTPEYIHQARYMTHPNGVTALSHVFLVVEDVERFVERYATYLDRAPVREGVQTTFRLPLAALSIVAARDVSAVLPGSLLPPTPCIAGVAFATPDVGAQHARLRAAGIRCTARDGRLIVPADEAFGVAVVFEPPSGEP
jgi:catechol 2,3-dioxygenase-like lactoylglutathione lyase family enzyme